MSISPDDYKVDAMSAEGFSENLDSLKTRFLQMDESTKAQEFPNILFLGTGSCIPNKARNVSSIAVQVK